MTIPWYTYPFLLAPRRVQANLARLEASGLIEQAPNLWQISLGVMRMIHRMVTRPESVGLSASHPVRRGWRARLFRFRPLRLPFLIAENAVAPWDLSGLMSGPETLIRHMIGTHHDNIMFIYDLQVLSGYPGQLDELRARARAVVDADDRRSDWLRDLVVYEMYHETLVAKIEEVIADGLALSPDQAQDPDLSFVAYIQWCLEQPETPADTLRGWRDGSFRFDTPVRASLGQMVAPLQRAS